MIKIHNKNRNISNISSGFTFIELSITTVLMITVAGAIFGLQYAFGQNQLTVWKNYVNLNDANSSLGTILREIRSAQPSAQGAYPLEKLDDNEMIFYSDTDFDSVVERIRYTRNANILLKGITKPSGQLNEYLIADEKVITITENIQNLTQPVFYYYNADWPQDTTTNPLPLSSRLNATRGVQCYLRINNLTNDASNDLTLEGFSQIRVLKDNI